MEKQLKKFFQFFFNIKRKKKGYSLTHEQNGRFDLPLCINDTNSDIIVYTCTNLTSKMY